MSNLPFGFGPPPDGPDEPPGSGGSAGDEPGDPLSALFGQMSTSDLGEAFQQIGRMLSAGGSGPVNWDLAQQAARQSASGRGDRSVSASERGAVEEAMRLAEHWLDEATTLPAGATTVAAWSQAEWIEETLPVWRTIVEPVAVHVAEAMNAAVPTEMQGMAGPLLGVLRQLGGAMFGGQVGQALGTLAGEVVSSADVGLPLAPAGTAALLPSGVTAFGEGLGVPPDQVRLYLALREAAHQRLFAHVPWLRSHLLQAVEDYARGITVDVDRLEQAVGDIDPANPQALQEALSGGLFEPQTTPAQQAALTRLETALALVEGWADDVVTTAATDRLPAAGALRETIRRRRASGGPGEEIFATLVGLELRPRRLREAAALWEMLRERRGVEGRDGIWAHPDLLPTPDDLSDPTSFVEGGDALDLSDLPESTGDE